MICDGTRITAAYTTDRLHPFGRYTSANGKKTRPVLPPLVLNSFSNNVVEGFGANNAEHYCASSLASGGHPFFAHRRYLVCEDLPIVR